MPINTYFAIGFGYSMIETDMIMWTVSESQSDVQDLWSTEFDRP